MCARPPLTPQSYGLSSCGQVGQMCAIVDLCKMSIMTCYYCLFFKGEENIVLDLRVAGSLFKRHTTLPIWPLLWFVKKKKFLIFHFDHLSKAPVAFQKNRFNHGSRDTVVSFRNEFLGGPISNLALCTPLQPSPTKICQLNDVLFSLN